MQPKIIRARSTRARIVEIGSTDNMTTNTENIVALGLTRGQWQHLTNVLLYLFLLIKICFYLYDFPMLKLATDVLRLGCFCYALLYIRFNPRITVAGGLLLLFFGWIGYTTYLHHGSIGTVISNILNIFTFGLLYRQLSEANYRQNLLALAQALTALAAINLISIIIAPNGILPSHVQGPYGVGFLIGNNYNQMGMPLLCAAIVNIYYQRCYHDRLLVSLITLLIAIFSPLMVGSKTASVGIFLFAIFHILPSQKLKDAAITGIAMVYLIFQQVAVFMRVNLKDVEPIKWFVVDILHKDLTFTGRTGVWLGATRLISRSPWIGYGYQDHTWFTQEMWATTTHNVFFQYLLEGGIIGLILLSIIGIICMLRPLLHHVNERTTLYFGLLTAFIMMMMEVYPFPLVALLFILLYYARPTHD